MTAKKSAPAKAATPAPAAKTAVKGKAAAAEDLKKAVKAAAPKAAEAKGKPGRKPKVDDKAKKTEESDVDLSDLESDLEGEPEVEAVAEDETKVKAKRCA